jgi:hypothetical protein
MPRTYESVFNHIFAQQGSSATEYAERGYSTRKEGILVNDWNRFPSALVKALEEHFELEWDDEWLQCDCGKLFRTQPDCYSWTMYGVIGDGDYACGDCVKANLSAYLDDYVDNPSRCFTFDVGEELVALGWVKVNFLARAGWYGRDDNPSEILKTYKSRYPSFEFVFVQNYAAQFEVGFDLWAHRRS